jgi:hypothetical protein
MFTYFRHDQIRRYLVAFGSLFNNVEVRRRDVTGADIQKIVVPITYGPKERWLTRLTQDPDLTQSVAQIVHRLSYEITSLTYDSSRNPKMLDQLVFPSDDIKKKTQLYTGVPFNIGIQLAALVKYQADGHQIVEQILPYFRPELTITMKVIPALNFTDQVPVVFNGVTESDNYEGDFEKRRIIIWTIDFTMRTYIYGPVRQGGRIQEVVVDVYDSTDSKLGQEFFIDMEEDQN